MQSHPGNMGPSWLRARGALIVPDAFTTLALIQAHGPT
jgi:hypothetical protein